MFKIIGFAGASTKSITFQLHLIDPCSLGAINIDPTLMETAITFGVYERNIVYINFLDTSLVTFNPASELCPDIELNIVNHDGSPLNNDIFTYDTETLKFIIDSQDPSVVGTYNLKVVASFTGGIYSQTDEHSFKVMLVDYTDKPYLQYLALDVIEVPERVQWPTASQSDQIPQEGLILSEIRYKQDKDHMELAALQMVFANGVESPLIEAADAPNEKLKSTAIDISRPVRYVRMKMYYGIYYSALWL